MAALCVKSQRGVWCQGHSRLVTLSEPSLPDPRQRSSPSPQPFSELDGEATELTTKTAQHLSPSCPPEQGPFPSGSWWPGGDTVVSPRLAGDTEAGQQGVSGSVSAPPSLPLQDEGTWATGLSLPQNASAQGGGRPLTLQPGATTQGWGGTQGQGAASCEKPGSPHSPQNSPPAGPLLRTTKHISACLRRWAWGLGCGAPASHVPHTSLTRAVHLGLRACFLAPSQALAEDTLCMGPVPGLCQAPGPC